MKKVALIGFLFVSLFGCDDPAETNNDAGKVPMDGSTVADTGPGSDDGGADAATDSGSEPAGACTNASDVAAIQATYDGKTVSEIAKAEGQTCFVGGATEESALRACVVSAVNTKTSNALSAECVPCYAISVSCGATVCLAPCLDTSTPAKEKACDECVCGDNDATRNCIEEFTACSGIPSDRCDDL
ncbi:MAG: hypothetical protein KC416_06340 [Myxococcales bacterium]|nr:hypothetical protein [Myxococcales bacterium]